MLFYRTKCAKLRFMRFLISKGENGINATIVGADIRHAQIQLLMTFKISANKASFHSKTLFCF